MKISRPASKQFSSTLEMIELKFYKWAAVPFDYFREI